MGLTGGGSLSTTCISAGSGRAQAERGIFFVKINIKINIWLSQACNLYLARLGHLLELVVPVRRRPAREHRAVDHHGDQARQHIRLGFGQILHDFRLMGITLVTLREQVRVIVPPCAR